MAQFGVPTDGTAAGVVLNVTGIAVDGPSFLTVYPNGGSLPATSSVNLTKGNPIPNAVFSRVGSASSVAITTQAGGGRDHVIVDVLGWFGSPTATDGSGFKPVPPVRLIDTRDDVEGPLTPDTFGVVDMEGVIPSGTTAVLGNVTAITPTGSGYLSVADGFEVDNPPTPSTSTVNYVAGQIVPNLAIFPVNVNPENGAKEIAVYNSPQANAHVVIDMFGYFGGDGALKFVGANPQRLLDTRTNPPRIGTGGRVVPTRPAGVPAAAQAVVFNATVTNPDQQGFMKVTPPNAGGTVSNLNFTKSQTVANAVVTGVDDADAVQVTANVNTDAVLDVVGWFETAAS